MVQIFENQKTISDFEIVNTQVTKGAWVDILRLKTNFGNINYWGFGELVLGNDVRSTFEVQLKDTSTTPVIITGSIRLISQDTNSYIKAGGIYANFRTNAAQPGNSTVKTGLHNLLNKTVFALPQEFLVIQFNADSNATLDLSATTINSVLNCTLTTQQF